MRILRTASMVPALVLLLVCPSAAQTPIDQGVVEHAVFPCDDGEAGFPCTITVAGSYRLTGDLTVPDQERAILVLVPGVTIDLDGHTITGPGAGASGGSKAVSMSADGLRVMNGTIKGFRFGLVAENFESVGMVAENLSMSGITSDSTIRGCQGSRITGLRAVDSIRGVWTAQGSIMTDSVLRDIDGSSFSWGVSMYPGCVTSDIVIHDTASGTGTATPLQVQFGSVALDVVVHGRGTAAATWEGSILAYSTILGGDVGISMDGGLAWANVVTNTTTTGLESTTASAGFMNNVLASSGTDLSTAGTDSLGDNLCSGTTCP